MYWNKRNRLLDMLGKKSEPFGEVTTNGVNPKVFQRAWGKDYGIH